MKEKMTKWFTPFRFAVPEAYEEWFEQLAAEGWHPIKVGHINSMKMKFEKGEITKYRYVVDMQVNPRKDYLQIYQDFGWEFVGRMSSLFVWRKKYEETKPESFSDKESAAKRTKKFITLLSVISTVFCCGFIALAVLFGVYFTRLNSEEQYIQFVIGLIFSGAMSFFMISRLRQFVKYKEKHKKTESKEKKLSKLR
ncbi:MAG: DUF2812 domain-containing protein [Clostridia bacterium]|nr:DUF2812 domain-containing protein [Clostridia bacterium]